MKLLRFVLAAIRKALDGILIAIVISSVPAPDHAVVFDFVLHVAVVRDVHDEEALRLLQFVRANTYQLVFAIDIRNNRILASLIGLILLPKKPIKQPFLALLFRVIGVPRLIESALLICSPSTASSSRPCRSLHQLAGLAARVRPVHA